MTFWRPGAELPQLIARPKGARFVAARAGLNRAAIKTRKRCSRTQLLPSSANQHCCRIGIEAFCGAKLHARIQTKS
jgi:hypothetical protein